MAYPFVQLQKVYVKLALQSLAAIVGGHIVGPASTFRSNAGIGRPSRFVSNCPCMCKQGGEHCGVQLHDDPQTRKI